MAALSEYYCTLLAVPEPSLWNVVTVRTHTGRLDGYEGCYIVWRGDGVHVSVPPSIEEPAAHELAAMPATTLREVSFWEEFARARGLAVIGPSIHAYLDDDPGPVADVETIGAEHLTAFLRGTAEADRTESGWEDDDPPAVFGLRLDGELVAASNLNVFHGSPRDVGVLVAADFRGRGLGAMVGQHAASVAIRDHGFARWGARRSNVASVAASRRLGFSVWCEQLAVRRRR